MAGVWLARTRGDQAVQKKCETNPITFGKNNGLGVRRTRFRHRPEWLVTLEGRAVAVAEAVLAYARGAGTLATGIVAGWSVGSRCFATL